MTFAEWVSIVISAGAAMMASILIIWSTRQDKARADLAEEQLRYRDAVDGHLKALDQATYKVETRVTVIESDMKHLPTADDIGKLYSKMSDIGNQVSTLTGSVKAMTDMVSSVLQAQGIRPRI